MRQAGLSAQGVVPYSACVGQVLQQGRAQRGLNQEALAAALGISQSAYSRLESGDTLLSLFHLRIIARVLGTSGADILQAADNLAAYLQQHGVQVTDDRKDNSAAVLIGLGLLAAAVVAIGTSQ